jgi:hypothetical protein
MGVGTTHQNRNVARQSGGKVQSERPARYSDTPQTLLEAKTALICPRCGIQGHHRTWEACARALMLLRAGRL